jgi:LysR family nod box-dependent transcriptional activator
MTADALHTLRSLNLNLIPILYELLHSASVSETARRLHLTQSAVSGSLRQLRSVFDDDLLVRNGRTMMLTEKARRLTAEVAQIVRLTDQLVSGNSFDPGKAENRFRIATADYMASMVTNRLSRQLARLAPFVSLSLSPTPGTSGKELRVGSLDLIICPTRQANLMACGIDPLNPEFCFETLMQDHLVGIRAKQKIKGSGTMGIEEYLHRSHVMYSRPDGTPTIEQEALAQHRLTQNTKYLIPYFTLIPEIVQGSDLIGVVPRRLAEHHQSWFEIEIFNIPYDIPPMEVAMIWHKSRSEHQDLAWLRGILRNLMGGSEANPASPVVSKSPAPTAPRRK